MLIKKILILFISYYLSNHLVIDRIHYDIEYFPIENFKQERYRCIRYINNNIFSNFLAASANNKIIKYIKIYPNAKCIKYKKDYIEYIINKNKIIIYNTLIHTTFYIILMIF
jgi:hypothetical protein